MLKKKLLLGAPFFYVFVQHYNADLFRFNSDMFNIPKKTCVSVYVGCCKKKRIILFFYVFLSGFRMFEDLLLR